MTALHQPMYENGALSQATGGPLRPGGMDLTERMLTLCNLPVDARILDLGCGTGGTVAEMRTAGFHALGVDRSELLLESGVLRHPGLPLCCAWGKALPIASDQMDAVFAECSLSAMVDVETVLSECRRVLRPGGILALSDVYARNPEGIPALRALPLSCGLSRAMSREQLTARLGAHGLEISAWEDHSETLKYLAAQMILSHGSMAEFWSHAEPAATPLDLQIALGKARLGYYLSVAQKEFGNNG